MVRRFLIFYLFYQFIFILLLLLLLLLLTTTTTGLILTKAMHCYVPYFTKSIVVWIYYVDPVFQVIVLGVPSAVLDRSCFCRCCLVVSFTSANLIWFQAYRSPCKVPWICVKFHIKHHDHILLNTTYVNSWWKHFILPHCWQECSFSNTRMHD